MPALKISVARISAGLAASALFAPVFCAAASLIVNGESPLNVTTPPGFTYLVSGADGSLSIPTDGFLLCSNVLSDGGTLVPSAVTVMPQHGDWNMPIAQDVNTVRYSGGVLGVNRDNATSLVCHSVGAGGELRSPHSDGIMRNGYESKTAEQYGNLINWIPSPGFDWTVPNWSLVPTDPCNPSLSQPAAVVEDVACAAVTGARNAGVGATVRAPTLWTGTDGANFFYVARIDARFGAQTEINRSGGSFNFDQPQGSGAANLNVVNAYDRGVVGVGGGYLGDNGQWCVLFDLPSALDGNVCSGAAVVGALEGTNLDGFSQISLNVPPLGLPDVSFYMAFVRPIVGPPPSVNEPAVAISILLEPSVAAEGGDKFRGDDVAFGFLPASTGFPWMTGGQ